MRHAFVLVLCVAGPVRVRAFGTYAMQVSDPATFLRQIVATDPSFETYEITAQLRNTIVARFADAIGQAKIAVLDLHSWEMQPSIDLTPGVDGMAWAHN